MNIPTPAGPGVDIEPRTLNWLGSVYPGCFVSLVPSGEFDANTLEPAVRRVLHAAEDGPREDSSIHATAIIEGVDALHIRIHYGGAEKSEVRAWASGLAAALTEAEVSGTLTRMLPQYPPAWVSRTAIYVRCVSVLYALRRRIDAGVTRRLSIAHGLDRLDKHMLHGGSEFSFAVPYSSGM